VIEDLVSMKQSMTELYVHSSDQWDSMYADTQWGSASLLLQ